MTKEQNGTLKKENVNPNKPKCKPLCRDPKEAMLKTQKMVTLTKLERQLSTHNLVENSVVSKEVSAYVSPLFAADLSLIKDKGTVLKKPDISEIYDQWVDESKSVIIIYIPSTNSDRYFFNYMYLLNG